jgi:hypothetical protein
MVRRWTWRRWLAGLLCILPLSAAAQPGAPIFVTAAWRNAPRAGGQDWSREWMLKSLPASVLGKNAGRQTIVDRLGPPGMSTDPVAFGAGRSERRDTYRLSAANETSLRVTYDPQRRVESHVVSPPGCTFRASAATSTVAKSVVNDKLMKLERPAGSERRSMSMAGFSALVGVPANYWWEHTRMGERNWMAFGKVWRIAGERRRYLAVASSIAVPHSDEPPSPDVLKQMDQDSRLDEFELVTFWPDCLPP